MSPDDIEQAGQGRLPFCAIATARPSRFFNGNASSTDSTFRKNSGS